MRVLVLGGGMAGLAAAHQLAPHAQVTVVQRGWRLGGKGASHRTADGRIEEHGLHVWLGYYDNAFRLMREVYDHLDRPSTDPDCPLRTWRDAFLPADEIVVFDRHQGVWTPWAATFRRNAGVPGLPTAGPSPADLVQRALWLLGDLASSVGWGRPEPARTSGRGVFLSAHRPTPAVGDRLRDLDDLARRAGVAGLIAASQAGGVLARVTPGAGLPAVRPLVDVVTELRHELGRRLRDDSAARRLWHMADLVATCVVGVWTDRLLEPRRGWAAVNHLDFREWLALHGAEPQTLDSGVVRGMYDLVFGYRDGDHDRPAFEAGTGLALAGRFFFDYKGSLFWKMRAGMGDVVFAPLYQSLHRRGVDFAFFQRLRRLRLSESGRRVEAVELVRQARPRRGHAGYRPLISWGGLPCFPEYPVEEQLRRPLTAYDLESLPRDAAGEEDVITLRHGRDFDHVVLAVSLGMLPHVAGELIEADPRWAAMVTDVGTVATRSLQVWTSADEKEMGWPHPGSTSAGYTTPFDTYASMSHLLETEPGGPAAVSYFCSALPDAEADPARVAATAHEFLESGTGHVWPRMRTPEGRFRWEDVVGVHTRANVDPSDCYVQSLPDSGASRIAPDASGFENLAIAGDWTDTGLNAGCIEAAVLSGLQAANAVRGKEVTDGVLGGWAPLRGAGRRTP